MNTRPLNPFLVSFALVLIAISSVGLRAQVLSGGAGSLSAQRSAAVGASESYGADKGLASAAGVTKPTLAGASDIPSFTLTREQLVGALREQLAAHYNLDGDLQLELSRAWTEPAPTSSPINVVVPEFPPQLTSSALIHFKASSDAGVVCDMSVTVKVQLLRDAWVAKQPLARDEVFDSSLLDLRRIDVLRERDVLPTSTGDRSYCFTRNVQAGRVLSWRDVAKRPLVRKGELVEVCAVDGPLAVNMRGLALQSGAAGEVVAIRNLDSKKEINAQVVSENRVQVRF